MTEEKLQSDTLEEAYFDRNQAVQLAARLAHDAGMNVWIQPDPDNCMEWNILYIELSTGQVSWHIPVGETMYEWGNRTAVSWDGHTLEEKRDRIAKLIQQEK